MIWSEALPCFGDRGFCSLSLWLSQRCVLCWSVQRSFHCAYAAVRKAVKMWSMAGGCCGETVATFALLIPPLKYYSQTKFSKGKIPFKFLKILDLIFCFSSAHFLVNKVKSLQNLKSLCCFTRRLGDRIYWSLIQTSTWAVSVDEHGFRHTVIFLLYSLGPHCLQRPVCPAIRALKSAVPVI